MTTPTWQPPQPVSRSDRRKGLLVGVGVVAGVFVLLVILGLIVGPQKKPVSSDAAAPANPSIVAAPSTSATPSPSASHPTKPTTAPKAKPVAANPNRLAHGAQSGFENCVIAYKDAQMGAGTSTFTAYVLGDDGIAYPVAASANYTVHLDMTITDTSGKDHAVGEDFGSGARTAADNGGSDWFTVNQGDVEVSADNAHGVLTATVQIPLAQVKSVTGNLTIMGNSDNSVTTKDCVVRPA